MLAAIGIMAAAACRAEPVDVHELFAANNAGQSALQRDELAEAETQFRRVTELAPRDPAGHVNLGLTHLRAGNFDEAEGALRRARRLDRDNVEAALLLARLYAVTGRADEARELLGGLGPEPRALYALAQVEGGANGGGQATARRAALLRQVLQASPGNLAVRLDLVDALLQSGAPADSAARHLEEIRRLRPAPPAEALPALDSAIRRLRADDVAGARPVYERARDAIALTQPYQSALAQVKWEQGPIVGRPVLSFKPQTVITSRAVIATDAPAAPRFEDVTAESGIETSGAVTAIALGDYDGDGMDNLVVSARADGATRVRAYHMLGGYLADITERSGLTLPRGARDLLFTDVDNDGWLDLFALLDDGGAQLLRNTGKGAFTDVSATTRLGAVPGAERALSFDLDHDGDLDLLVVGERNRAYRNNLDGTFTGIAEAAGLAAAGATRDAAFADFDGDGRTDVVLTRRAAPPALYLNAGMHRFQDAGEGSGLSASGAAAGGRIAVGDYDNDGTFDVAIARHGGIELWRNNGAGKFARDERSGPALRQPRASDAEPAVRFVDHDNDGWLDLVEVGGASARLLRNDGDGRFVAQPRALTGWAPAPGGGAAFVTATDVDDDGDQDLFLSGGGALHLLRNQGGNTRLAMQVQLMGLRTGSGKNNTFGIGSRIEVRAGEIYQTRVVTDRVTHIGLGPHLKADVLRVEWTNGVPQVLYFPGTDADVLELEHLKGSCAFLYTWDGTGFRFVTDVMWRSALGMPLGIMAGTDGRRAAYAPAGASQEYLRIPGDALRPRDGRYVLQFTEELWETAYLDEIRLLAVDHPDSMDVYVDERFVPPGPVQLRMYRAVNRRPPVSAVDGNGADVLAALRDQDHVYVSNLTPLRYQGLVAPHELVLDLGVGAGAPKSQLFLRGWIYPTDASINVALGQQSAVRAVMPSLEVRNARGEWQVAITNLGFPSGKDKTIVVDLAGIFPTSDHRVRIRTNMHISWDQAFVAIDAPAEGVRVTELAPAHADLHYRGFSRPFRKGGRHGPHWFDYASVTAESPWRTIEGAFTRFGDVLPLVGESDDRYVIMGPGDEATVEFDATAAPAPPAGWRRTFLLYTDGWIKDADLNTAHGNTVEPLPFHAIRQYPYAAGESYPTTEAHERYRREYNTRVVRRAARAITDR